MMQQWGWADSAIEAGDPGLAIESGFVQGKELRKRLQNHLKWSNAAFSNSLLKVERRVQMRFSHGIVLGLSLNAREPKQSFRKVCGLNCLVIIFAGGVGFARRLVDSAETDQVMVIFALFFK